MVSRIMEKTNFPREISGIKFITISEEILADRMRVAKKTFKWPHDAATNPHSAILTTDTTMSMKIIKGLDQVEEKKNCLALRFKAGAKFTVSSRQLSVFIDGRFVRSCETFLYDWKPATVRVYLKTSNPKVSKIRESYKGEYSLIQFLGPPVLAILTLLVIWLAFDKFVMNPLLAAMLVLGSLGMNLFIYFKLEVNHILTLEGVKDRLHKKESS